MLKLNLKEEKKTHSKVFTSSEIRLPEELPSVEAVRMRAHRLGLEVVDQPPSPTPRSTTTELLMLCKKKRSV